MTTFFRDADGGIVQGPMMAPQPLIGDERDEIVAMVMRLKRADERTRRMEAPVQQIQEVDLKWAEDWQLPREVFDYFVLEHAA